MSLASIGNHLTGTVVSAGIFGFIGHLTSSKIGSMAGTVFGVTYGVLGLVLDPLFNAKGSHSLNRCIGITLKVAAATATVLKVLNFPLTIASAIDLGRQIVHKSPLTVFSLIITLLFVEIISDKIKNCS